jgi:hypothetical protein
LHSSFYKRQIFYLLAADFRRFLLRIQNAVHIERRRLNFGLTQHDVYLPAMVRLVIEQVQNSDEYGIGVMHALAVCVREGSVKKTVVGGGEEILDGSVLARSSGSQLRKLIVQNGRQPRRSLPLALETGHPYSVAQKNVVQKRVNAAEGAAARCAVVGVAQFTAFFIQPLVRNPVVSGQQTEMVDGTHETKIPHLAIST